MISKMKKLTFLIFYKEYEEFIGKLREMGVVHISVRQKGEMDAALEEFVNTRKRYTSMLNDLKRWAVGPLAEAGDRADGEEICHRYEELQKCRQGLAAQLPGIDKDLAAMQLWGEFDWKRVEQIEAEGWNLRFFACMEKEYDPKWEETFNALRIAVKGAKVYFVTLSKEVPAIEAESLRLPEESLEELQRRRGEVVAQMEEADKAFGEFCAANAANMEVALRRLDGEIDLRKVRLSGAPAAEGSVRVLEGWVPEEYEGRLLQMLDAEGVCYEMRSARKDEAAPIKFKNNAFVRMYEVLTKMYGVPDYGEFDPTPLIAPFFTLFFGFCVGDAGYGLALIALGFYLRSRMSDSLRGMMNLVITLGVGTTIMGAIMGTFFGVNLFDLHLPESIRQFMVAGKIDGTNYDKQMLLALIIGVVHICIAMTVKAISSTVRYGFRESLSHWGWLLLVVGFITTGGLQFFKVISEDISTWAFIVIGSVASIGIYLLNNIHRNVFANIGAGLWDTYNMATGLLGDSLSYIRLYALGLAGGMLGGVFNQLGLMVNDGAGGGILGWVLCGLIMVAGHTLNIAMSCLSAFVHPLRLTFVEFFKNSGYEGKGEEYKPFSAVKEK